MCVAFYFREMRAAEPVINPRLFQNRIFTRLGAGQRAAVARRCSAPSCSCRCSCRACWASRRPTPASSSCRSCWAPSSPASAPARSSPRPGSYKVIVIVRLRSLSAIGAWLLSRMGVGHHLDDPRPQHGDHGPRPRRRDERLHGDRAEPVPVATGSARSRPGCSSSAPSARPIGMAVFGTILNNQFAALMKDEPAGAALADDAKRSARRSTTRRCCSRAARQRSIHAMFASSAPRARSCSTVFMDAVRLSLSTAITSCSCWRRSSA